MPALVDRHSPRDGCHRSAYSQTCATRPYPAQVSEYRDLWTRQPNYSDSLVIPRAFVMALVAWLSWAPAPLRPTSAWETSVLELPVRRGNARRRRRPAREGRRHRLSVIP